jgi:hypothetical protein
MATTTQRLIHAAQIKAGRGWGKKKRKKTATELVRERCDTEAEYLDLLNILKEHDEAKTWPALSLRRATLSDMQKHEHEMMQYERPKLRAIEHRNEDGKPFMIDCPEWVRDLIKNREG